MAFKELIKDFSKIRTYLKEFFVYGYNSRGNVGKKSDRSYDDEKRRIQSYLGDYIQESHGEDGKTVALSIDVRNVDHNPLYRAWKSASFTDKDITLHFILMDILQKGESLSLSDIISKIDEDYLSSFEKPLSFDESTLRKKLAEYEELGLVRSIKDNNRTQYSLASNENLPDSQNFADALDFASEILPLGIIGSTLLDKLPKQDNFFAFKHHYITQSLDSEVMVNLFDAINKKCWVKLYSMPGRKSRTDSKSDLVTKEIRTATAKALPLKIFSSSTTGRQYVAVHVLKRRKLKFYRLDNIVKVEVLEPCSEFDRIMDRFKEQEQYLWGVSFGKDIEQLYTVSFTVKFREDEEHIYQRLVREKRNGTVERQSPTSAKYSVQVYAPQELFPWIRTFICRITELSFGDEELEKLFWDDVRKMRGLYVI